MAGQYSVNNRNDIRDFAQIIGADPIALMDISHKKFSSILKLVTPENNIQYMTFIICFRPIVTERLIDANYLDYSMLMECVKFYPPCLSYIPVKVISDENFCKLIIENIQPEWYDFLPDSIAGLEEVQKKCSRTARIYSDLGLDKDGYNPDWLNKDGELISFFTLRGNFPINSKLDYYKIYEEYIKSKTSVSTFCKKYGISPVKGFEEFLKRISAESFDDSKHIKSNMREVQKRFFSFSKEMAKKIVSEEIQFETLMSSSQINFNSLNLEVLFNSLGPKERRAFSIIIMDYIDNHQVLVSNNFIKLLSNGGKKPIDIFNSLVRPCLKMPEDRENIIRFKKQTSKVKGYSELYRRNDLYCTYLIGDQKYEVNDEIIDEAYTFMKNNDYNFSRQSVRYVCKEIATGNLVYEKETRKYKDEMLDGILELIHKEKSMEDYLSMMRDNQDEKKTL